MQVSARLLRNLGVVAGSLLWSAFGLSSAMAATITYNFQGTVDQVGNQVLSQFANPSSMFGSITVTNHVPAPPGLTESYSIQSFQVTMGSYTATMGTSGQIDIRNGNGVGLGADRFIVTVNSPSGDDVNFFVPRLFEINLRGPGSLFSSDALPSPVPSISSFNTRTFRLQFGGGNGLPTRVSGLMTSLTAVPLPAAVILFGVGLVALIGLGAGGLRNMRLPQA